MLNMLDSYVLEWGPRPSPLVEKFILISNWFKYTYRTAHPFQHPVR